MRKAPVLLTLLMLAGILGACAGQPLAEKPAEVAVAHLLSGTAIFGRPVNAVELPQDLVMSLTPEMRRFLAEIAPGASPQRRLVALIKAFEAQKFHIEYDEATTLTAAQTFHKRRGNCLSFTLMMVAMARELGAEAYFNQVVVPPVWSHDVAQTFVVYRHVNMVSKDPRGRRVVDFNLAAYDPAYDQRRLDDTSAVSLYYSNRGVEFMRAGEGEKAFLYLRKALELRPEISDLWANLGAFYSHFGYYSEAEQSYRQALYLNNINLVAMSNLARLYRYSGREGLANAYAERARHHRERNPYYLYYQARDAYEQGEYKRAEKRLRRAVWHQDDHRFHFLLGLTRFQLGDMAASRQSFKEAFSLVKSPYAVNVYERKLGLLLDGLVQPKSGNSS
ncbi:tetratricopeptide repeat protein [Microbulbifer sp. 2304DJ12-6]|uniref:tetratricopeptide repeat protein n=1 Tax=Microbulbifer sp. 2304DJ12-6 TaxID=3233340 RepID=UPI0039AE9D6A